MASCDRALNWALATIAERTFKKDRGFGHHICFYVNAYYAEGLGYKIGKLIRGEVEEGKVRSLQKRDFPDLLAYLARNLYAFKGTKSGGIEDKKVIDFMEDVRTAAAMVGAILNYKFIEINRELEKDLS